MRSAADVPADAYVSVGRVRARATDGYPRAGAQPGSTPGAGAMTSTLEDLWGRTLRLDKEERSDMSYLLAALIAYLRQREADVVAHATGEVIRHTDDWKFSDIETVVRERDALAARVRELEGERDRLRGDFECAVKEGRSAERVVDHRIVEAVAAEREACAKLCEEQLVEWQESGATGQPQLALAAAARYIRSRPTPATGGREYEEGVVVLRVPFEPNVPLIRESLEKHFGSADPPPSAPGEVCGRCRGGGRYHTMVSEHMGGEWKTCPDCHGTGKTSGTTGVDAHPSTRSVDTSRAADGPEEPRSPSGDSPAPSVEFGNEHPVDTWIRDHDRVPVTPNVRSSLFALLTRAREEGRRLGLEQAAKECVAYADAIDDADSEAEYAAGKCAARIQKLANGVEW